MTEKRFYLNEGEVGILKILDLKEDNEAIYHTASKSDMKMVVELLNELNDEKKELQVQCNLLREQSNEFHRRAIENANRVGQLEKENKELKSILQDMGLLMSNEEVKNVRDKISSKLIKPLCKRNGFDVDVNTENGFTIIPKGVNNDRE